MGPKKDSDRSKTKRKVVSVFEQPLGTKYVRQPRFHCTSDIQTLKGNSNITHSGLFCRKVACARYNVPWVRTVDVHLLKENISRIT
jgi:hypothetical protein